MKKIAILFLIIGSFNLSGVPKASDTICWQMAKQAFDETNIFRAKKKLPKVAWSQALANIAREHSINMALHKVEFGHHGFNKRLDKLPLKARAASENVYMSDHMLNVPHLAVVSWVKSPGHLKNLIGDYKYCGIGVYKNKEGFWYFTQIFASF